MLGAVDDGPHLALEHLEVLVLARVQVLGRSRAVAGIEGLHLEQLAVGLVAGLDERQPEPAEALDDVSLAGHAQTLARGQPERTSSGAYTVLSPRR